MNNKGFTLVELLATIAVLSMIIAIGIVSYNKIDMASREETRNNIIKSIEIAASKYASNTNKTCVQVSKLITSGYLEADENGNIIDPVNKESLNNYYVEMTQNGSYYNAHFKENGSSCS